MWTTPISTYSIPHGLAIADTLSLAVRQRYDEFKHELQYNCHNNHKVWCHSDINENDAFFAYQQNYQIDLSIISRIFNDFAARFAVAEPRSPKTPTCWASLHANASHHPIHTHAGSSISGVFNVRAPSGAGSLVLLDPRGGFLPPFQRSTKLPPIVGDFFFFPSSLPHLVEPSYLPHYDPRITVSCNRPGNWSELSDINIQIA